MKKKVYIILLFCLLMIPGITPFIPSGHAVNKPNYVGFNEGQEFIWLTQFDKDPYQDYLEDLGVPKDWAENYTDYIFDMNDWDDDAVAWRIYIIEYIEKDDDDWTGTTDDDEDDVEYLRFKYSIWEADDLGAPDPWDAIDRNEKSRLYEPEEVVYSDMAYWGDGLSLLFVPKGLNWDKIKSNLNDYYEDQDIDDRYDASTEDVMFFFMNKEVGLKVTEESNNKDVDDFECIAKYTSDGIAYYLEWSYDGDPIYIFELSTFGFSMVFLIENWWWITLIIVGAVVALVVVIIVLKKRK